MRAFASAANHEYSSNQNSVSQFSSVKQRSAMPKHRERRKQKMTCFFRAPIPLQKIVLQFFLKPDDFQLDIGCNNPQWFDEEQLFAHQRLQ